MISESVTNDRKKPDMMLGALVAFALFTAFTSGLSADVGPVTITLSNVLVLLLVGYSLLYSAMTTWRVPVIYRDDVSLCLYLFCFSNLFSSLLFSADKWHSLKACGPLILGLLTYTAIRTGIRLMQNTSLAVDRLILFNNLSAGFGFGCMMLAIITGIENIGVSFGHLSLGMVSLAGVIPPSIKALTVEPNLFAIGTGTVLCLTLGRYLMGDRARWFWISVMSLSILFAYTRSVYGALVVALVVLMVLSKRTQVIRRVALIGGASVVIIAVIGISLPKENSIRMAFTERISTMFDFESGTGGGRLLGYQAAWKSFLDRPIFGKGTLSADTRMYNPYSGEYQERMGGQGWLTGSGIQALHDTGVVGLAILVGLFSVLIWKNYRLFQQLPQTDEQRSLTLGFLGGNIILLITSQLSSPLWTAFPYIYWAVNMEFIQFHRRR